MLSQNEESAKKTKDAPLWVQSPYSNVSYNFQPVFKLIEEHYFFQVIEDISLDLDKTMLFIVQNINWDTDAKSLASAVTHILLVKEFFNSIISREERIL